LFIACILLNEIEYLAQDEPDICLELLDKVHFMVDESYQGGDSFKSLAALIKLGAVSAERQQELNFDPEEELVECPKCEDCGILKSQALAMRRALLVRRTKLN
jgi:hypothetical protein